jgi:transcriptional regulator
MKVERIKGHLDLLLLSVLSQSPGHGYAVITQLRDRSDGMLALTEGSVYPALHRLEDLGLLESEWQPVANRRRRVYRVTPTGARALRAERRDWQSLVSCVEAVLTPLPTAATGSAL